MLVDDYEQYQNDRTDDVVVSRSGSDEPDQEPRADDCKNLLPTSDPPPPQAARGPRIDAPESPRRGRILFSLCPYCPILTRVSFL